MAAAWIPETIVLTVLLVDWEKKYKQVICTACGASLEGGITDGWSTGAYIGLLALSFFIPVFGWIYGGIQVGKFRPDSKRKNRLGIIYYLGLPGLY